MSNRILKAGFGVFSKLVPSFYYPYSCEGGKIYLDITESPMMFARVTGRYEVEKHAALRHFLNPGGTFVDVGANKGDFSLLAAKVQGESGRVLSFEPEPNNYTWLRTSIERNGYSSITAYQMALSDSNGLGQLHLGKKSGWHSLLPRLENSTDGVIEIQLRTLDGLLSEEKIERPINVIKIDVEGAEMAVLRGATQTLDTPGLTLLMDIHPSLGVDPAEVCGFLTERGYRLFDERAPFDNEITDVSELETVVARRPF